jgi:signal transduction histidine kinase
MAPCPIAGQKEREMKKVESDVLIGLDRRNSRTRTSDFSSRRASMPSPLTRTQRALIYVGAWVPYMLLQAVMLWRAHVAPNPWLALYYAFSYVLPGILVGALIWRLESRICWAKLSVPTVIAIETLAAIVFAAVWQVLFLGYLRLVAGEATMRANAEQLLGWPLLMSMLVAAVHGAAFHVTRVVRELRDRELAIAQSEALRVRAEMEALRGQLDPHFLFNSLHSITALVRADPPRAEDALLQFSGLLRRVLDLRRESGDEVRLADELEFVDDYLAIERLRLAERLRIEREISPAALNCWLPAFTLQPLIENSIRHAIAPRREGGTIALRATVEQGVLILCVEDNGPGATSAVMGNATGVGLSATRRRLQLQYGAEGALEVQTAPGEGFKVTVRIPAHTDPLLRAME